LSAIGLIVIHLGFAQDGVPYGGFEVNMASNRENSVFLGREASLWMGVCGPYLFSSIDMGPALVPSTGCRVGEGVHAGTWASVPMMHQI
jgi:hypothetical protein